MERARRVTEAGVAGKAMKDMSAEERLAWLYANPEWQRQMDSARAYFEYGNEGIRLRGPQPE
jgi:hypothetical protein